MVTVISKIVEVDSWQIGWVAMLRFWCLFQRQIHEAMCVPTAVSKKHFRSFTVQERIGGYLKRRLNILGCQNASQVSLDAVGACTF